MERNVLVIYLILVILYYASCVVYGGFRGFLRELRSCNRGAVVASVVEFYLTMLYMTFVQKYEQKKLNLFYVNCHMLDDFKPLRELRSQYACADSVVFQMACLRETKCPRSPVETVQPAISYYLLTL